MATTKPNQIRHLVCDSGAFITGCPIEDFGQNIYTLPEVVAEIKDENTRQRLQIISYEIKYREPSAEDIKFVANFAKKTGDYCQLSAVDIKVIALTLRLEKEINGDKHIRNAPEAVQLVKKTVPDMSGPMVGFCGFDKKKSTLEGDHKKDSISNEDNRAEEVVKEVNGSDGEVIEEEEDSGEELSEEDSEDGWITPSNVEEIRRQMMGITVDDEVEEEISVGCLTGDYAMQNVLLQMGLKAIGVRDGLRIRRTKQFVLRCFACFKISTSSSNGFCNSCGNHKTLKRVSVTVRDDGTKEMFINFKKAINIRGTRYSLPTPKGGKHTNNPILVADQPIPQQRKSKFALEEKKRVNVNTVLIDPEYVNRTNPFAINDVYSRSARTTTRVRRTVNPNETRRPTGNRKKREKNY